MVITLHLCVLYGSQDKQQLLLYTSFRDCFFLNRSGGCLLRGTFWVLI